MPHDQQFESTLKHEPSGRRMRMSGKPLKSPASNVRNRHSNKNFSARDNEQHFPAISWSKKVKKFQIPCKFHERLRNEEGNISARTGWQLSEGRHFGKAYEQT